MSPVTASVPRLSQACTRVRVVDQHQPAGGPARLLLAGIVIISVAGKPTAANDDLWGDPYEQSVIVEGDILVPAHPMQRAIVKSLEPSLWQDGIIPYRIDDALPTGSVMSVMEAIAHWNRVSGISLKPFEEVATVSGPVRDLLRFIPGDVCASWVGRRGGEQPLWVAPNCNSGSVMHEIGHALGLEHEHTRPDRGNYIHIHWENIDPEKRHNFDVGSSSSRMLGSYDYQSIMHYGQTTFSINGEPTITPKQDGVTGLGQRRSPSPGDLEGIAELYGTDLSVITRTYNNQNRLSDEPLDMHIHVTNQRSQGAHDITLHINAAEGQILSVDEQSDWHCLPSSQEPTECKLDRLAAGSTTMLSLRVIDKSEDEAIQATITSKTPDLDLSNNRTSGYEADETDLTESVSVMTTFSDTEPQAVGRVGLAGSISQCWFALLVLLVKFDRVRKLFRIGGKHRWDLHRR